MSDVTPTTDRRWAVAQSGQRRSQELKRQRWKGHEQALIQSCERGSQAIRRQLAAMGADIDGRTLEVGSGAHGLIWRWPSGRCVALDPLALFYRDRFDFLQADGPAIIQGRGEELPFADGSIDLVISDNVIDHAQDPGRILREILRVLDPRGRLYLTVDTQHRVWRLFGGAYDQLVRLGLEPHVPAFPNHPFQLSARQVEGLLQEVGFAIDWRQTHSDRSRGSLRRPHDLLKRVFFRNRRLCLVASKIDI